MIAAALIAAAVCPGPPAVAEDVRDRVFYTRLVACVGDRRVVIRRGRVDRPFTAERTGVRIFGRSAAGRWIAWTELRYAKGRTTGVVVVARIARGRARIVEERVAFRSRGRAFRVATVVVTTRGELVWAAAGRLVTARAGSGAPRTLARDADAVLGIEDGRTVRWWRIPYGQTAPELAYTDLRPWPRPGCPTRRRFRTIARSDQVLVTKASYGRGWDRATAIRACLRATGADPVVAAGLSHDRFRVAALAGEWVVFLSDVIGSRGFDWFRVEAHAAGSGRAGAPVTIYTYPGESAPARGRTTVVTASGVPAWIVPGQDRWALVTTGEDRFITLDATTPGGLTGLVADGTTIRWLHDGEPRAADLG